MHFLLPGGTGQIGTFVARDLLRDGHTVTVLSRSPKAAPWPVVEWDAKNLGPWTAEIDRADVVLNLATNRALILDSRVDSTRVLGQAIAASSSSPSVWLQSSTATIYAHRFDTPNDEATGILGGDEPGAPDTWRFSITVAKSWEAACNEIDTPSTRKVLLRSAMVMSPDRGGVFSVLLSLVRKGLGGSAGGGKQYVSWIHYQDFIRALHYLVQHDDLDGPVNVASPNPLPNAEFMRALRAAWGARIGLPATRWMIEIGTFLLRTESELILKSRRVVPGRLLAHGFVFEHPEWAEAARDLCERLRWDSTQG